MAWTVRRYSRVDWVNIVYIDISVLPAKYRLNSEKYYQYYYYLLCEKILILFNKYVFLKTTTGWVQNFTLFNNWKLFSHAY